MRARVQVLRRAGRQLEPSELGAPIEGRLLTHAMMGEQGQVASLQALGNNLADNELLARLYLVRLIGINGAEWRLSGLERLADGREALQEWVCSLW